MSNMSYCRWENTSRDFEECVDALEEGIEKHGSLENFLQTLSSDDERRAFKRMIQLAAIFIRHIYNSEEDDG